MLHAIRLDQPTLVWIQWSHLLQEPGRRPHVRTALEFFAGMIEEQLKHRCHGGVGHDLKRLDVLLEKQAVRLREKAEALAQVYNKLRDEIGPDDDGDDLPAAGDFFVRKDEYGRKSRVGDGARRGR